MLHVTCYMLHVTWFIITNIYIPLWEDSQWYAIKNLRQIWQRIARFRHGGDGNWRNMLLIVLYIILICTYHCERIHSGISWNPRQIWQRIARFRRWGDESWKSMLLIVLYYTDLYIPLWEDSQWYIMKPASDLAEDCQIWRWGDGNGEITLLIVHIYITNVCIPLWEDSQWYTMKPTSDLAEDCQIWR